MDKKMKRNYQMPSIKVVAFKVEEGFQGSKVNVGVTSDQTNDLHPQATEGNEYFERQSFTAYN